MAVPDPDLPHLDPAVPSPGNRPRPASGGGRSSALSGSNRPIPLKPREKEFPTEEEEDEDDFDEESEELREILRNAPAWLVSTVAHMLLLIILGLMVVGSKLKQADLDVEIGYAENVGEQLENPAGLSDGTEMEETDGAPLSPTADLASLEQPIVAPPTLERIQIAPLSPGDILPEGLASGTGSGDGIGIALSGRGTGTRGGLLKKYGGTKGTEDAVELGLAWLAEQQLEDGSWSLSGPYPDGARAENTAAATAMALLAFQGHGDTHKQGRYQKTVAKGWAALLKMQDNEGLFKGTMAHAVQLLYTHAQCTIAICEIYGMTNDTRFRRPAAQAVKYCIAAQDKEKGGWRYQPRMDSDTSVTGWFVMALQSARMAELQVPNNSLREVSRYLDSASIDDGRRYGYWQVINSTPAMCAEGLLCRMYLGWKRDDPRLVEGVTALLANPVAYNDRSADQNVYYWYYATQAAHHMEGEIWERWNSRMRVEIPAHQLKDGPETGSWEPQLDKWGNEGGRLFVTCLSIYNLEVYYRHLPLYAGYQAINQLPPIESLDDLDDGAKPDDDAAAPNDEAMPEESPADEPMPEATNPEPEPGKAKPAPKPNVTLPELDPKDP
jgi:hypothetical protein